MDKFEETLNRIDSEIPKMQEECRYIRHYFYTIPGSFGESFPELKYRRVLACVGENFQPKTINVP